MVSVGDIGKTGLRGGLKEVKQLCAEVGREEPATLVDLVSVAKDVVTTMRENLSLKEVISKLETSVRRLEGAEREALDQLRRAQTIIVLLETELDESEASRHHAASKHVAALAKVGPDPDVSGQTSSEERAKLAEALKKLTFELVAWRNRAKCEEKAQKASLLLVNAEKRNLADEKAVFEALTDQYKENISELRWQSARATASNADNTDTVQASPALPAVARSRGATFGVAAAAEGLDAKQFEECEAELEEAKREAEVLRNSLGIVRRRRMSCLPTSS